VVVVVVVVLVAVVVLVLVYWHFDTCCVDNTALHRAAHSP
jgi:hypothetical protein